MHAEECTLSVTYHGYLTHDGEMIILRKYIKQTEEQNNYWVIIYNKIIIKKYGL